MNDDRSSDNRRSHLVSSQSSEWEHKERGVYDMDEIERDYDRLLRHRAAEVVRRQDEDEEASME